MIKIKLELSKILTIAVAVYCFTIFSFQGFIPGSIKRLFLIAMPVGICILLIAIRLYKSLKIKVNLMSFSIFLMFVELLIWNNHVIRVEGIMAMYGLLLPILFYMATNDRQDWHVLLLKTMVIFAAVYAAATFICTALPVLYYGTVGPMMRQMYPISNYKPDPKAGFTAHYSTNGMYLCNGLIALAGLLFAKGKERVTVAEKCLLAAILIAFLICGKRGMILYITIATYITYFFYMTNRKKGRIFKLVVISFVAVLLFYLGSLIIPGIANAYDRMLEQLEEGDISTGRFELWAVAWDAFLKKPLFGHGWRWFYYNTSVFENHDVHNCYLQLLVELGVVGSIPFFVFLFGTYIRTLRLFLLWRKGQLDDVIGQLEHNPLMFCMVFQTYFLIYLFTGTAFFNPEVLFPYLASCAMIQYVSGIYRNTGLWKKNRIPNRKYIPQISASAD